MESFKKFGKEVLLLLMFALGFLYYLFGGTRRLREENVEREKDVQDTLKAKEAANAQANDSVAEYERLRDKHRAENGDGSV